MAAFAPRWSAAFPSMPPGSSYSSSLVTRVLLSSGSKSSENRPGSSPVRFDRHDVTALGPGAVLGDGAW